MLTTLTCEFTFTAFPVLKEGNGVVLKTEKLGSNVEFSFMRSCDCGKSILFAAPEKGG